MLKTSLARLGILMLDSRFPRIAGDVGNPQTWPFPVRYGVVKGATPDAIVRADPEPFIEAFVAEGHRMVDEGCTGIATTCGFLSLIRPRLAEALGVPVAASALEQAGQIKSALPAGRSLGILTISAESLSPAHLAAAGVPEGCPITGMEGTEFFHTFLGNRAELDIEQARADMVATAKQLVERQPQIGALLLECTNMVPYAPAVARATGRPVFSIQTYLTWFHGGLQPASFA
jgi:hypothetical protein